MASVVLLFGTGLYGSLFWVFRDRGPAPKTIRAAAAVIRDGFEAEDQIFLLPAYATRAREYLGDLHPLAVRAPQNEDLETFRRVWVLGLFGAGQAVRSKMRAAGLTLDHTWRFSSGGVRVDRYLTHSAVERTYAFLDHLDEARVVHEKSGRQVPCNRRHVDHSLGGSSSVRWRCPKSASWFYVAEEWHRMGEHTRRCLWAHPPDEGRLLIRYPAVATADRLVGHAGHTLYASHRARAPVFLEVGIGDRPPERFVIEAKDTFTRFEVKTPLATTTTTVSFAVFTKDAGANHFCFTAELRGLRRRD